MLIRLVSDLHINGSIKPWFDIRQVSAVQNFYVPHHDFDKSSILVIAGDVSSDLLELKMFLQSISMRFLHVIFVPGNHEGYGNHIEDVDVFLDCIEISSSNISTCGLSSTKVLELHGIRFILGTLWGDGGKLPIDRITVQHGMNDFRYIKTAGQVFDIHKMIQLNKQQKKEIREALKKDFTGKTIVVTHHVPSRKLISERFLPEDPFSDGLSGGFCGSAESIIKTFKPDLWLFGHTHDRKSGKIFKTRIECNPRGYKSEHKNTEFNTYKEQPIFICSETLELKNE